MERMKEALEVHKQTTSSASNEIHMFIYEHEHLRYFFSLIRFNLNYGYQLMIFTALN